MRSLVVMVVALVFGWLAAGCSTFNYATMDLCVRYDAHEDVLTVLEVERGVFTIEGDRADEAADAVEQAARGRRIFPANRMFSIDFEKWEKSSPDVAGKKNAAIVHHMSDVVRHIRVN